MTHLTTSELIAQGLDAARKEAQEAGLRRQVLDLTHELRDARDETAALRHKVATVLDSQRPRAAVRILRKWLGTT